MAKNNRPETYRGRRRKLNVLGIVLSAVAVLIVVLFVLCPSWPRPARRRTRASAFSSR